jgi:hypothetical protein
MTPADAAISGLAGAAGVAAGEIMIVGAQALTRSGTAAAIETTSHGAERAAGQGATRGGVLSAAEIQTIRSGPHVQYSSKVNGATALVQRNSNGRYDVVVQNPNDNRLITSYKNLSQKSLDRTAKNYQWDGYEPD